MESVKRLPAHSVIGSFRTQVAARRGKNIATVAHERVQEILSTSAPVLLSPEADQALQHALSAAVQALSEAE